MIEWKKTDTLKRNYIFRRKNKDKRPNEGKKCLKDEFDKLSLIYADEEIKNVNCDAYWKYTL